MPTLRFGRPHIIDDPCAHRESLELIEERIINVKGYQNTYRPFVFLLIESDATVTADVAAAVIATLQPQPTFVDGSDFVWSTGAGVGGLIQLSLTIGASRRVCVCVCVRV